MKISELPKEIRKKALKYQNKCGENLKTNLLVDAFYWRKTKEGFFYWNDLHDQEPPKKELKEPLKPKQYQIGIDTFTRAESNLTKEEILAICKFNIDKYCWRIKDQDKEDFKKIIDYANWAIKNL